MKKCTALLISFLSFCLHAGIASVHVAEAGKHSRYITSIEKVVTQPPYSMEIEKLELSNNATQNILSDWIDEVQNDFLEDCRASGESAMENMLVVALTGQEEVGPYLNLKFSVQEYMGGAHPEVTMETFLFDMNKGERLMIEDLLYENQKNLSVIATYVIEALEQKRGRPLTALEKQGLYPSFNNYRYFALSQKGLCFYFPVYQTGSRGDGEQSVTLDYRLVANRLRPDIGTRFMTVYGN